MISLPNSHLHLDPLPVCKEESYWMKGGVKNVKERVWIHEVKDRATDIGAHLGLRGVNLTLVLRGTSIRKAQ